MSDFVQDMAEGEAPLRGGSRAPKSNRRRNRRLNEDSTQPRNGQRVAKWLAGGEGSHQGGSRTNNEPVGRQAERFASHDTARPTHETIVSAQALLDHFVEMFGDAAERSPPWDHERKYKTRVYV